MKQKNAKIKLMNPVRNYRINGIGKKIIIMHKTNQISNGVKKIFYILSIILVGGMFSVFLSADASAQTLPTGEEICSMEFFDNTSGETKNADDWCEGRNYISCGPSQSYSFLDATKDIKYSFGCKSWRSPIPFVQGCSCDPVTAKAEPLIPPTTQLSAPELVEPGPDAKNVSLTPTLKWKAVPGVDTYVWEIISINPLDVVARDFFIDYNHTTQIIQITIPSDKKLKEETLYQWDVVAYISSSPSQSAVWRFTTLKSSSPSSASPSPGAAPTAGKTSVQTTYQSCPPGTEKGLVPCGRSCDVVETTDINEAKPCQFCDFFVMINNIVKWIFRFVPIIAALMFAIGGGMFFFAGAKPDMLNKAKGVITSVVIGLVIIFAAWVIVNTIIHQLGIVKMDSVLNWYDIGCK